MNGVSDLDLASDQSMNIFLVTHSTLSEKKTYSTFVWLVQWVSFFFPALFHFLIQDISKTYLSFKTHSTFQDLSSFFLSFSFNSFKTYSTFFFWSVDEYLSCDSFHFLVTHSTFIFHAARTSRLPKTFIAPKHIPMSKPRAFLTMFWSPVNYQVEIISANSETTHSWQ